MEIKHRIAFCISWQARTFDMTYNYFKLNLFDAAKKQWFDYDIFCAVEDDEDAEKVEICNPTLIKKIKSNEVQKIIDEKYWKYLRAIFDKKACFVDKNPEKLERLLQQLYKIKIANELKIDYASNNNINYDIVVRLRFDDMFIRKINFIEILKHIKDNDEIIVNGTPNWKLALIPIADFFAFWSNKSLDIYSSLFDNFKEVFNKNNLNILQKILLFFLNIFKKIMFYFEEKNIKIISKYSAFLKFWVYILANYFFINVYVFEKVFYENLVNNKLNIKKTSISNVLIRSNSSSIAVIFTKSEFEI